MIYIVELSNRTKISIEVDELPNVLQGIKSGMPVIVRQGIFNPSFFVSIVEDKERLEELEELNDSIKEHSKRIELEPLIDIFKNVKLLK